MVGVTGLEPATSRPPAVRATNCATPRRCYSSKLYTLWGREPHGHLRRPRNFVLENKFSREGCLASCHWQLSPQPYALPTALHPVITVILKGPTVPDRMTTWRLTRWVPAQTDHGLVDIKLPYDTYQIIIYRQAAVELYPLYLPYQELDNGVAYVEQHLREARDKKNQAKNYYESELLQLSHDGLDWFWRDRK